MSNLSDRVAKAKKLRFIPAVSGEKGCYNTYGSNDNLYRICLKSGKKTVVTPDGDRVVKVFRTNCQKPVVKLSNPYEENCEYCKGNTRNTVCYHCLGAIWWSMKNAGWQVSFFSLYHDAINGLNFGGNLAKVENNNGTGAVWCVYRKQGDKKEILSIEENINLMRGSEDDEGID